MRNIYLIGFMASGKTTLAKLLAKRWGNMLVDTDYLLLQEYNATSITELFLDIGVNDFRMAEARLIRSIRKSNCIVATGGGLPCYYNNMEYMNQTGDTIYISCELETLYERLRCDKSRPLLLPHLNNNLQRTIADMLAQRETTYSQATYKISNDGPIDATVEKLEQWFDTHI